MKKLLFVNACINRKTSRTLRLARALIGNLPECEVEELVLEEIGLKPLDSETINRRDELSREGRFDDTLFDMAHKLAEADYIVIATPFWENTFNSMTKVFMEYSGAVGVSFRYSEEGMPVGLCKAKCLYYVTTRGGPIPDEGDMGYMVYRTLAHTYGIPQTTIISANALDIVRNDSEKIMRETIEAIPQKI